MPTSTDLASTLAPPLTLGRKLGLLARIWITAGRVVFDLSRMPLQDVVKASERRTHVDRVSPTLLSRAVSRGLRIGPWQPRCLIRALVLFRLLGRQGDLGSLVIGLPDRPSSPEAHAWVELAGRDVGPLPGRGVHRELSRYPRGE